MFTAADAVAGSRLDTHAWRQVSSAVLPGSLIALQLGYIATAGVGMPQVGADLDGIHPIIWIYGVIVVLALSYALGQASRGIAYGVARRFGKAKGGSPSRKFLTVQPDGSEEKFDVLSRNLAVLVWKQMMDLYKSADLARVFANTPIWNSRKKLLPGYFTYCKSWLQLNGNAKILDVKETEINVLFAMVIPVVLSVGSVTRAYITSSRSLAQLVIAVLVASMSLVIAARCLRVAAQRQRAERFDCVRLFFVTQMYLRSRRK